MNETSKQDVGQFTVRVARVSDSRYNGIVTMHETMPAGGQKPATSATADQERRTLNQSEFQRLLEKIEGHPRSHAALVVRLLHTGLLEARRIQRKDVHNDFFLVPGSVSKSGLPRVIPFVNSVRRTLMDLHKVSGEGSAVIPQSECKRSLQTVCRLPSKLFAWRKRSVSAWPGMSKPLT